LKIIWITGGSSGIGFATAKKFLNENWIVVISSRNIEKLKKAKIDILNQSKNNQIHLVKCDISKKEEVYKTISYIENNIGPIDLALLNAAAYSPNKSQKFDIKNFEILIDVNIKGTLYCIEVLIKYMELRKKGQIAIVSSPTGYRGLPTAAAYGMTKAGLTNLAESLFFDLKKMGIKVNIINPGFIESDSTKLNDFPMPFLKPADFAAKKIYNGLIKSNKFEITFPLFFILILKTLRILPYRLYFYLIRKMTNL
tara:strand:+ start:435 stop:1196 length:762 start_codon:yes stop_codon:yes gene_type:complete